MLKSSVNLLLGEPVVKWLFTSPCTNESGVQFPLRAVCANGFQRSPVSSCLDIWDVVLYVSQLTGLSHGVCINGLKTQVKCWGFNKKRGIL